MHAPEEINEERYPCTSCHNINWEFGGRLFSVGLGCHCSTEAASKLTGLILHKFRRCHIDAYCHRHGNTSVTEFTGNVTVGISVAGWLYALMLMRDVSAQEKERFQCSVCFPFYPGSVSWEHRLARWVPDFLFASHLDALISIKPKLAEDPLSALTSLVNELRNIAALAESFALYRSRANKDWYSLADVLDREGLL